MEYQKSYLKNMESDLNGSYMTETYQKDTFLKKDYKEEFESNLESLLPCAPYE